MQSKQGRDLLVGVGGGGEGCHAMDGWAIARLETVPSLPCRAPLLQSSPTCPRPHNWSKLQRLASSSSPTQGQPSNSESKEMTQRIGETHQIGSKRYESSQACNVNNKNQTCSNTPQPSPNVPKAGQTKPALTFSNEMYNAKLETKTFPPTIH